MRPTFTTLLGCALRMLPIVTLALVAGCGDGLSRPSGAHPRAAAVDVVPGSGAPGCEETDDCYSPFVARIRPGGKVTWTNGDSAAHTITSGTLADGVDGRFDSGLIMSGGTFVVELEEAGTYDYFCMVHPWMRGVVVVK